MATQQLFIVLLLLVPVTMAAILLVYLFRRRGPADPLLAIIVAAGGLWAGGYALEFVVSSEATKLWIARFDYFAYVAGPIGWFLLGVQMHNRMDLIGRPQLALLLLIPVLTLIQVFTYGYHHFFWSEHRFVTAYGLTMLEFSYGPGFWLHLAYSYALNMVGALLVFTAVFESGRYYVGQRAAIAVALILPWLANIVYVTRAGGLVIDPTPFAIVVSGFIMITGVFRFGIGDLVPVARARVLAAMKDGVMVLDESSRVVDYNEAAAELLPAVSMGTTAEVLFGNHPKLLRLLQRGEENTDIVYTMSDRAHRISSERLTDGLDSQLLLFRDLSTESRIQDALRLVTEGTSQDVGEGFFLSLTQSLAGVLNMRFALVGSLRPDDESMVDVHAFWDTSQHLNPFSYSLEGTPCEDVFSRGLCVCPERVSQEYPDDKQLEERGIEGYLGTRLHDHTGKAIGVLIVMDDKRLANLDLATTLLELFANRAAAELERRNNEERIEDSEQSYRRIVETTEDGVCVTDGSDVIEFVNEPMAALLSVEKETLVGAHLWELLTVVGSEPESIGENRVECRLRNSTGKEIWVHITKTRILDHDGTLTGVLNLFRDVSEEKALLEANRKIEEHLQHAQKMESLGVLAGGVAHDFNNLLVPILGYIDLLKQRIPEDSVSDDYLQKIQLAGGKLADLCNQMLTYSGKGHFIESVVDINGQITELYDLIRASVPHSITLELSLQDELARIKADATQLNQVLMNLIINASEAMTEGVITVTTGEQAISENQLEGLHFGDVLIPGNYVFVEVADEGVGLSEEETARLFEPFFTTKFTGRGLGMAVVYGIVRAHAGAIQVESEKGKGTRIRVLFPTSVFQDIRGETVLISELGTQPVTGKVLVVDDEEYVRELVSGMLESIGFDVVVARNGTEGLQAFDSLREDLKVCVIDITMPGMGGMDLLTRIREQDAEVPVLLISGYSQQSVRDPKLRQTNVGFLQKPFTVDQMKHAIQFASDHQIDVRH